MKKACRDMQDRIADYALGVLDEQQAQQVQAHLSGCSDCREYLQALTAQSEALAALGRQVEADMNARQDRVLQALEGVPAVASHSGGVLPWAGRLARIAVAAVLALGVGIGIGRLTAPRPVDVEQLRADLERETLATVDERLKMVLDARNAELKAEIGAQIRRDLGAFATQFVSGSEAMVDRRLGELVQLIEAARLKDRQRVARAFEHVELNRRRDRTQIGLGLQSLAALTNAEPTTIEN